MAFVVNKSISWKVGISMLGAGSAIQFFHGSKDLLPLVTSGAVGSIAVLASMKLGAHLWKTLELSNELVGLQQSIQDSTQVTAYVPQYQALVLKMQKHFDNSFDTVLMQGHTERWSKLCDVGKSLLEKLELDSTLYVQHSTNLKQAQDFIVLFFYIR